MSGLVSGYSGIIAPTNLVTNGAFRINQRDTFSTLTPAKVGDYVSDCWYIGANTNADYLEVRNYSTEGLMQFVGYGKKGQRVEIQLKPRDNFGYGVIGSYNGSISPANSRWHYTTSWMTVLNTEGVDIQARFQGPYDYNDDLWHQDPSTLVKSGEIKQTTACINQSRGDNITTGGWGFFILEEDGEFNVRFYHATCVTGAFKHPPKFVPVPYADDLARCQRYYQKGMSKVFGYRESTSHYHVGSYVSLATTMVSTPSISLSNVTTLENGVDGNKFVTNGYTSYTNTTTDEGFFAGAKKVITGTFPDELVFNWTAEVV